MWLHFEWPKKWSGIKVQIDCGERKKLLAQAEVFRRKIKIKKPLEPPPSMQVTCLGAHSIAIFHSGPVLNSRNVKLT